MWILDDVVTFSEGRYKDETSCGVVEVVVDEMVVDWVGLVWK